MTKPFYDEPARLKAHEIDDLVDALDPGFVAGFPICPNCARPLVVLGVPFEPATFLDADQLARCRPCFRKRQADWLRRKSEGHMALRSE